MVETNAIPGIYEFGGMVGSPVDSQIKRSDIWTKHYYYQCAHDPVDPLKAYVVGAPSVIKVCEYDDGKWAWVGLGERVRLKVEFPSDLAEDLCLSWGKNRQVETKTGIFVVCGHVTPTDDGHTTLSNPRVVSHEEIRGGAIEPYVAAVMISFATHLSAMQPLNA